MAGRRIVLTTFGSLGDLHPFLALARGLKDRGHRPVLATLPDYHAKVEAAGIEFSPVRPAMADLGEQTEVLRRIMDQRTGPMYVIRDVVMRHLRDAYDDFLPIARGADLVVTQVLTFSARLAVEKLGLPWASTTLQPFAFFSTSDFPVVPIAPAVARLRWLGPRFHSGLLRMMKWLSRPMTAPLRRFRAELGLPPAALDPLFEGQYSPALNLALFSRVLSAPQPDWPANTVVTGFPFFDRGERGEGMGDDLRHFLEAGPPPVVFTLGSSGVYAAGDFYRESARAAERLRARAVLLVGDDQRNRPDRRLPESIFVAEYAPYSELFPRAAAVVHQGGVGTTGQGLRAGVPMLVVPFSHDQPDNADRVCRLGVARTVSRRRYTAVRAAFELRRLLGGQYAGRAAAVGKQVRAEDGVAMACTAIEAMLKDRPKFQAPNPNPAALGFGA